jgi:hypothetical protein
MKVLLYDRDPKRHGIDLDDLLISSQDLHWHHPKKGVPQIQGVDVFLVHVSDDETHNWDASRIAIEAGIPLVLYSGEYSIASNRASDLNAKNPRSHVCTVFVDDLCQSLQLALDQQDLNYLCWNPLSDVLELLSSLWAIGLCWETQGVPYGVKQFNGSIELAEKGVGTVSLLDTDGKLNRSSIGRVLTSGERTVDAVVRRLYGRAPRPAMTLDVLLVSECDEYFPSLVNLRDSLLEWAESRK